MARNGHPAQPLSTHLHHLATEQIGPRAVEGEGQIKPVRLGREIHRHDETLHDPIQPFTPTVKHQELAVDVDPKPVRIKNLGMDVDKARMEV